MSMTSLNQPCMRASLTAANLASLVAPLIHQTVVHPLFSPCAGRDAELQMFLEPLALHTKDLVLLAVNDNQSNRHAGGSHW